MGTSRLDELRKQVTTALHSFKPAVAEASAFAWHPTDGLRSIFPRAALCRQYESLEAIVDLTSAQRSHAGVPLLRPACEELLWLRYLNTLCAEHVEAILVYMTQDEYLASIRAQEQYAGRTVMRNMGLAPHLDHLERTSQERSANMSTLGKLLNWPRRNIKEGTLPSMRFVAKATDNLKLYQFLYHATSRFVHFSGAELCRRAWGGPGNMSVSSQHFHDYWGAFSLFWGLRVFIQTTLQCPACDYGLVDDGEALLNAIDALGGAIPIVTAEELKWPT